MKTNTFLTILIILIIVLIGIQQYIIWSNPKDEDIILKEIVKLESKIDILSTQQEELKKSITETEDSIVINEKQHEEIANYILINNDSVNRIFIDNYIKDYLERFNK
jgi:hypothetical protein